MMLRSRMADVAWITGGPGGLPRFLIARQRPSWDNPQMRAARRWSVAASAALAEPGR
jgi:hypothetical protein